MGESTAKAGERRKGMALARALFATYRGRLVLSGIMLIAENASMVIQAVTLGWLIGYFDDEHAASWEGWTYACAVVASGIAASAFHHHFFFIGEVLGMQIRVSTTTILYDKILRLRLSSLGEATSGHLVNLATTDVERFQFCAMYINCIWGSPLSALVTLALGLHMVGVSLLAGFAALFMLIPLQALFSRKFAAVRQRVTVLTDERVKLTNQVITGARLMKLNAWEPALEKEIQKVRAEEVRVLMKATLLRAVNEGMFFVQPAVLGCLVFGTYHFLGNELTPAKVFTTLVLLTDTQFTMGKFLSLAVQSASESWVSIKRIERVLLMEENKSLDAPLREMNTAVAETRGEQRLIRTTTTKITPCEAESTTTVKAPMPSLPVTESGTLLPLRAVVESATDRGSAPTTTGTPKSTPKGAVGTEASKVAAAVEASTNEMVVPAVGLTDADVAAEPITITKCPLQTTAGRGQFGEVAELDNTRVSSTGTSCVRANGDAGSSYERPGYISMKGPCFRWTKRVADEDLANMLQSSNKATADNVKQSSNGTVFDYGGSHVHQTDDNAGGMVLEDISLDIKPGMLVGVVGPVGSSKSSLLMAVLREISPDNANGMGPVVATIPEKCKTEKVSVGGTVAYASQEPWITSGTLRDNITFGRRMDPERYESVLRDCSLQRDLSILPSGDMTGIGDRGVNLSGGQKARVGLARMAYAHADVYLMDDPLSAVDPAVGRELFSRVVCGRLSGRTRILVTHQVHYLRDPAVDAILVMDHGKIIARGSYDELEASGMLTALECPVSSSENLRKGVKTTPRADRHYLLEPSAEPNDTITSPSRPVPDESPLGSGNQEADDSEEWDLAIEMERTIGNAALNESKSKNTVLGLPIPDSAASPGRRHRELTHPRNGAMDCEKDVARSNVKEPARKADIYIECVVGDRIRSRSPMCRSGESLPRVCTPVGDDDGQGSTRLEASSELVAAEYNESGKLHRGTYWKYLREAASAWKMMLITISMVGGQVLVMLVTIWLAEWSRQTFEEQQRTRYITVLVLLTLAAIIVSLLRAVITFASLVTASRRLHDRMLKRIIGAPILFFDSNPIGRILNRFTKDMDFMDDLLPMTMYDFTMCTVMAVGGTLLVFVVNPWVVLSMLPSAWYFWYLQGFYVKTSREVKRLDAVTRSPVYSQLSETLDGLVTIRAFGMQRRFLRQFTERVDLNTRAYFAYLYTARWLGFRFHMVVTIVLIASCFFSVAVHEYSGALDAGLLGAALLYTIQLGGLFQWAVKQSAELENQMVSTERVLNYCKVPQEANLKSEPSNKPSGDWPAKGNIEIRDLCLRYREDLPPVLKGLNLSIPGGSRVGVVGRTGAGKSSLIAALFRLVEYDRDRGGVTIDDVDISKVGLHDLRLKMSVVPQTPFLFSGSMRLNLDPLNMHSDVDVWAALEAVQMKSYVQGLSEGLDAPVSEGGSNVSVGQRQLLCLARAVLHRSQILVLDEATANIDQNTDFLIQDVVRTRFTGRTVIMVAHRLNTVIDCDQVVVLSEGRVVEAGHPHLLLQASAAVATASLASTAHTSSMYAADKGATTLAPVAGNATLASMVDETGPASSQNLRRLAREAWKASASP